MYIDELDIVNKNHNAYQSTIEMKPVHLKSSANIDFNKENNDEDPHLTLLKLEGVIFACGKFKFKLFLNNLWYEPETL